MAQNLLNRDRLKEALVNGKTFAEAAEYAGSTARTKRGQAAATAMILKRNPDLKIDITKQMEGKRQEILNALSRTKIKKANAYQLTTMAAILTDKINLLAGLPTVRITGDIDFTKKTPEEVKQWLLGALNVKRDST